jgi:hypothetical protein
MLANAEKIALPCAVLFVLFDGATFFVCGVIDAPVHRISLCLIYCLRDFLLYHYCYYVLIIVMNFC